MGEDAPQLPFTPPLAAIGSGRSLNEVKLFLSGGLADPGATAEAIDPPTPMVGGRPFSGFGGALSPFPRGAAFAGLGRNGKLTADTGQ
jgi:hypothetical protein